MPVQAFLLCMPKGTETGPIIQFTFFYVESRHHLTFLGYKTQGTLLISSINMGLWMCKRPCITNFQVPSPTIGIYQRNSLSHLNAPSRETHSLLLRRRFHPDKSQPSNHRRSWWTVAMSHIRPFLTGGLQNYGNEHMGLRINPPFRWMPHVNNWHSREISAQWTYGSGEEVILWNLSDSMFHQLWKFRTLKVLSLVDTKSLAVTSLNLINLDSKAVDLLARWIPTSCWH